MNTPTPTERRAEDPLPCRECGAEVAPGVTGALLALMSQAGALDPGLRTDDLLRCRDHLSRPAADEVRRLADLAWAATRSAIEAAADEVPPAPVVLHCRWCHREVSEEARETLVRLLRALRYPFPQLHHDPPLCPEHVADRLSNEANRAVGQAKRQAVTQPWRR